MTYPANILSADEALIKDQVEIEFTDPDNQPGQPPFSAAETGTSVLWKDSPDGDPILAFDADIAKIESFYSWDFGGQDAENIGTLTANAYGPGAFLTTGTGAPSVYASPLYFDDTAVSGGLYAWDGSAYVQVGGPLA